MIVAIATAEIAFWVVLLGGLTARYVLRREQLSTTLLLCVPLVDVALVCFVAVDIARGAPPSQGHALAAVYLGVTVAFGHSLVSWADARFKHRFAGGPKPVKPAKGSRAAVRALWVEWFRVVEAVAIAAVLLLIMIALDGFEIPTTSKQLETNPYWGTMVTMGLVTFIWFLAGPAFAGRGKDEPATR